VRFACTSANIEKETEMKIVIDIFISGENGSHRQVPNMWHSSVSSN
jgi:hypothetical protein